MKPTIFVTNWQSVHADNRREASGKARRYSGPAEQHFTIMARPRPWLGEEGDGRVYDLIPDADDVRAAKDGFLSVAHYRWKYLRTVERPDGWFAPCSLMAGGFTADDEFAVTPDSTIACACSRAEAAEGRCHRVWAAGLLLEAGWRVVLDGSPLAGVDDAGRPVWEEPTA